MDLEHERRLTEVEARSKSNTKRLNELSSEIEAVNRLATAVEVMAKEQGHQTEAIREVKADVVGLAEKVETIEKEPAKRWKLVAEKVITTIAAAVVGFILARVGL